MFRPVAHSEKLQLKDLRSLYAVNRVKVFKGIIKFWNMPSYLHGSIEVRSRIIFDFIHTCRILPF